MSRINDLDSGVYGSAGGSRARCINSNVVEYNVKLIHWLFQLGWWERIGGFGREQVVEGEKKRKGKRRRGRGQDSEKQPGNSKFSLQRYQHTSIQNELLAGSANPLGWVYLVQPLTSDYPLHPTSGVSLRRQHYILHILSHLVALCSCNVLSFGMRNDEKSLDFAKVIKKISCHHV